MFELRKNQLAQHNEWFITKGSSNWNNYTLGKVGPSDLTNLLISKKELDNVFDSNLLSSIYYKLDNKDNKKTWLSSQMKLYLDCETIVRNKIGKDKILVPVVLQVENKDIFSSYDALDIETGMIYEVTTTTTLLTSNLLKHYMTEIIHEYYVLKGNYQENGIIAELHVLNIGNGNFLKDSAIQIFEIEKIEDDFSISGKGNKYSGEDITLSYETWLNYCDEYLEIYKNVEKYFFIDLKNEKTGFDKALSTFKTGYNDEIDKLIVLANNYGGTKGLIKKLKDLKGHWE